MDATTLDARLLGCLRPLVTSGANKALSFDDWMSGIRGELIRQAKMTPEEAQEHGSDDDWRGYFDTDYTPSDAVSEDMSYSDD